MVGHWHEFRDQNPDFENCYVISDSTISINNATVGGTFFLNSLDLEKIWKYSRYSSGTVPNYKVTNGAIEFENGIEWIRQTDNQETFLKDFSAGYKIKINPIETTGEPIEPIDLDNGRYSIIIALGKLKPQFENRENGILSGKYYFQTNDKLTSNLNDLIEFISCIHCQMDKIDLYVNMDKDTPLEQKKKLDSVITFLNLSPNQIFFQRVDIKKMKSGYKTLPPTSGMPHSGIHPE